MKLYKSLPWACVFRRYGSFQELHTGLEVHGCKSKTSSGFRKAFVGCRKSTSSFAPAPPPPNVPCEAP